MPGGVTFNGRQFYDDAVADLEKLTEEIKSAYSMNILMNNSKNDNSLIYNIIGKL